jgi:hypothetical protein
MYARLPELTDLVNAAWKRVWHHLDPVSQEGPPPPEWSQSPLVLWRVCQPHTSTQRSGAEHGHEAPRHQPAAGFLRHSYSLFDEQEFNFLQLDGESNVACIRLGHLSVYIMSFEEDIRFKHMTKYPDARKHGSYRDMVRCAVVCRWLGRRIKSYCGDYETDLRYMEKWKKPDDIVEKKFPGCKKARENFAVPRNRRKSMKNYPRGEASMKNFAQGDP